MLPNRSFCTKKKKIVFKVCLYSDNDNDNDKVNFDGHDDFIVFFLPKYYTQMMHLGTRK
jgi:hypothetical protein